jgi:hypothetical protein
VTAAPEAELVLDVGALLAELDDVVAEEVSVDVPVALEDPEEDVDDESVVVGIGLPVAVTVVTITVVTSVCVPVVPCGLNCEAKK